MTTAQTMDTMPMSSHEKDETLAWRTIATFTEGFGDDAREAARYLDSSYTATARVYVSRDPQDHASLYHVQVCPEGMDGTPLKQDTGPTTTDPLQGFVLQLIQRAPQELDLARHIARALEERNLLVTADTIMYVWDHMTDRSPDADPAEAIDNVLEMQEYYGDEVLPGRRPTITYNEAGHPLCPHCGRPLTFTTFDMTYRRYYDTITDTWSDPDDSHYDGETVTRCGRCGEILSPEWLDAADYD